MRGISCGESPQRSIVGSRSWEGGVGCQGVMGISEVVGDAVVMRRRLDGFSI